MLTLLLTAFSFSIGAFAALFSSVAVVIYFSLAAATIVALLAFVFGSGLGTVVLAWFVTILAVQFGFVFSSAIVAIATTRGWKLLFSAGRNGYVKATDAPKLQNQLVRDGADSSKSKIRRRVTEL